MMELQLEALQKIVARLDDDDRRSRSRSHSRRSRSTTPKTTVNSRLVSDGSTTPVLNKTIIQVLSPGRDIYPYL